MKVRAPNIHPFAANYQELGHLDFIGDGVDMQLNLHPALEPTPVCAMLIGDAFG